MQRCKESQGRCDSLNRKEIRTKWLLAHLEVASTWAIRASVIRGSPGSMANGDGSDAPPASIRSTVPMGSITTRSLAIAAAKIIAQNITTIFKIAIFVDNLPESVRSGDCLARGGERTEAVAIVYGGNTDSDYALSNAPLPVGSLCRCLVWCGAPIFCNFCIFGPCARANIRYP